jgi:hypothetical protein
MAATSLPVVSGVAGEGAGDEADDRGAVETEALRASGDVVDLGGDGRGCVGRTRCWCDRGAAAAA